MIYKLTNEGAEVVVVEVGILKVKKQPIVEIRSVINLKEYNKLLENKNPEEVAEDFNEIAYLREWMWDEYFARKPNVPGELEAIAKYIKSKLLTLSYEYNLKINK